MTVAEWFALHRSELRPQGLEACRVIWDAAAAAERERIARRVESYCGAWDAVGQEIVLIIREAQKEAP